MRSRHMTVRTHWWLSAAVMGAVALAAGTAGAQATYRGDTLVATPQAVDRAWFGFSIACSNCTMTSTSAGMRWRFSEPPGIVAVEPGSPADKAGLRVGDVLSRIDDEPLTSDAGAERFGSARAGQAVRFTIERGGRTLEIPVRTQRYAVSYPAVKKKALPVLEPTKAPTAARDTLATKHLAFTVTKVEPKDVREKQDTARRVGIAVRESQAPLRFSGSFGNSDITVRGPATTVVMIADRECWMEVRTGDAVVRLQLRDGCGKSPLERR